MTPQRAKELAPVIAAYGEGKTIQYRSDSRFRWDDYPNNNPHSNPTFTASGEYRIKPEPTWRMWKPEEVPVGGIIVGLHNEYTAVGAVHAIATITTDAVTVVLKTKNGEVPTRTDTLRVIPGVTEWYWGCNPNQRFKVGVLEEPK